MSDTKYCKDCKNINCPENRVNCKYPDAIACHLYRDTPPTVFEKITTSPEVLAEKSVYAHECCRIPDGATSPFIDEIFWFDDEKGDTWDERFDSAWEKAKNATLARLNEVAK